MRVLSSAPTRISLSGGGTDLPVFYERHQGLVVSLAINIRQNISLERATAPQTTSFMPENSNPDFYRTIIREMGLNDQEIELQATFEGKIQSGLGTSASAAVALISSLSKLKEMYLNPGELAELAWDIEVNRFKMYGGKQDQYAAAFGGMNTFHFSESGVKVESWEKEVAHELEKHLLLFHTGIIRTDTKIQEELLSLSETQIIELEKIRTNTMSLVGAIKAGDMKFTGHIIAYSWEHKKRSNSKVTSGEIDKIYDTAMLSGAYGGKLCGSGGGGYIFFVVPPQRQLNVIGNLAGIGCNPVDFSIDYQGVSTRIL